MILKHLLLAAALVAAATPTLAADDFIPHVSLDAGAIGVVDTTPGADPDAPYDNKPELPGKEDGTDIYFVASSPDSQALSDMLSWRWRLQARFQVRRRA